MCSTVQKIKQKNSFVFFYVAVGTDDFSCANLWHFRVS